MSDNTNINASPAKCTRSKRSLVQATLDGQRVKVQTKRKKSTSDSRIPTPKQNSNKTTPATDRCKKISEVFKGNKQPINKEDTPYVEVVKANHGKENRHDQHVRELSGNLNDNLTSTPVRSTDEEDNTYSPAFEVQRSLQFSFDSTNSTYYSTSDIETDACNLTPNSNMDKENKQQTAGGVKTVGKQTAENLNETIQAEVRATENNSNKGINAEAEKTLASVEQTACGSSMATGILEILQEMKKEMTEMKTELKQEIIKNNKEEEIAEIKKQQSTDEANRIKLEQKVGFMENQMSKIVEVLQYQAEQIKKM